MYLEWEQGEGREKKKRMQAGREGWEREKERTDSDGKVVRGKGRKRE